MRTEKQIAASRANGAKSRGPRSPRRPANPAFIPNQTPFFKTILCKVESPQAFRAMEATIHASLQPQNAIEYIIACRVVAAHWFQLRHWTEQRDHLDSMTAEYRRLVKRATAPAKTSTAAPEPHATPDPVPQPQPEALPEPTAEPEITQAEPTETEPQPALNPAETAVLDASCSKQRNAHAIAQGRLDRQFFRAIDCFLHVRKSNLLPTTNSEPQADPVSPFLL